MKKRVELSIIILNYKTKELTQTCIDSIIKTKTVSDLWEIILVDNGSNDGSIEYFENKTKQEDIVIDIISLSKNIGFASGNNVGIERAQGEYILLLNSDTEISEGSIQYALEQIKKDATIGGLSVKLVLPTGSIDPACHRGFPTPWAAFTYFSGLEKLFPWNHYFSQYHQWYKDLSTVHEVDAISGAFFLTRKQILEDIHFLDEDFFMYGEDLDLAYRLKQKNYKIIYAPEKTVLHKKKKSGRENENKKIKTSMNSYFYQTMKLFYTKHYLHTYPSIIRMFIFFLLDLKIFLSKI